MARDNTVMRYLVLGVVISAVLGMIGGLVGGWGSLELAVRPELVRLQDLILGLSSTGTRPTPPVIENPIEVIPVESRPLAPAYPAAFAERRQSSVLRIIRRSARGVEEPLAQEREFASAVAITSDGWIATSDAAITGLRVTELAVAVGGRVRPVERGVRDRSTGIVYLKIATSGLPTPAFVRASDVVSGAAIWVEAQPRQLHPEIILTVRAPSQEPMDSMVIGRRFLISMPTGMTRPIGASVWDGAGRLVGLVEKMDGAGQAIVIPATTLGSSLSQWLANGSIHRASLGVRALDLSGITLDMATSSLPTLGAWVRGVTASGPSMRQLQVGDVIERIERDILDGTADLGERLLDYRPGVNVTLTGRRRGAAFSVQVPLADETVSETIK